MCMGFKFLSTRYYLLSIMYKLCYPNGTVFQTYETRIDAELDHELMFDETVIVYE